MVSNWRQPLWERRNIKKRARAKAPIICLIVRGDRFPFPECLLYARASAATSAAPTIPATTARGTRVVGDNGI